MRAHADLATYLATLLADVFDGARLAALPEALIVNSWGTPQFWPARSLPRSTTLAMWLPTCHPTPAPRVVASSALPGERGRIPRRSSSSYAVYMHLPQPIASCLRSPPEDTKPPILSSAVFPALCWSRLCALAGCSPYNARNRGGQSHDALCIAACARTSL